MVFPQIWTTWKIIYSFVTGFGCSVPAYMAARTLKKRDRLLTIYLLLVLCLVELDFLFMYFCGGIFSEQNAGNILFLIYISGAILGLFAAKILKS